MKNTNTKNHACERRAEQVTNHARVNNRRPTARLRHDVIYLGADVDKQSAVVTRIIDHSTPQPAQRFAWEQLWAWVEKQRALAKKVCLVYEAGALGFWPYRKLKQLGVEVYVVHPEKLDPRHKRVQTDRTDSRHLAERLQRYVEGNQKAMTVVYVPTEAEELQRLEARHRQHLVKHCRALQVRGQGLLLSQGMVDTRGWWQKARWEQLQPQLAPQLRAALEDDRALIAAYQARRKPLEQRLEAAAPKALPLGFGALTFVLLRRELCNYQRFANRRQVGGFTGLCGGVSQSASYRAELSINKAGSPYLRTLLIELAWRVVYWQPQYTGLKVWRRFCDPRHGAPSKRRKKLAIVALARQLAVDLWRWQCGLVTPAELGWTMRGG